MTCFDVSENSYAFTYEHKLRKNLFKEYDRNTLPVKNTSDSVNVTMGVEIARLDKVVRKSMLFLNIETTKINNNYHYL